MLSGARLVPYERRIPLAGSVMERMVAPLTDMRERVLGNLRLVYPGIPDADANRIFQGCVNNFGRVFAEFYSARQFKARLENGVPGGPGLSAVEIAAAAGRPIILVTGHFGNFATGGIHLISRGHVVGTMYRPMNNVYFNRHYVRAIESLGKPVFPRGRSGTKDFVSFVRRGGVALVLNDQYASEGDQFSFMGLPARTSTAVARLAVRTGALLVPFYGIRKPNGLDFEVVFETPVEHGNPYGMTQELNSSLEARVRAHPEQWYWIHRRWKDIEAGSR